MPHAALPILEAWFAEAWVRRLSAPASGFASVIAALRENAPLGSPAGLLLDLVARTRVDPASLTDQQLRDIADALVLQIEGGGNEEPAAGYLIATASPHG
ncbi:MAG: hypothetical protein ACLGH3_03570 [Actinomycetota bacterium]